MEAVLGFYRALAKSFQEMADSNRETSRTLLHKDIETAADLAVGVLGLQLSFARSLDLADSDLSHRVALVVAATRGHWVLRHTLLEANYIQGMVLLRQLVEGQFALKQVREGSLKRGKVANPSTIKMLRSIYGRLSDFVHLTKPDDLALALGGYPLSLDPIPDPKLLNFLFGTMILSTIGHALEFRSIVQSVRDGELETEETAALEVAIGILVHHGLLTKSPQDSPGD